MHVAFFNRSFYPDTAATGQLLTELCEDLVHRHGYRVSVVAGASLQPGSRLDVQSSGPFFRREEYRGIRILRARGTCFPKRTFLGRVSNYLSYFLCACAAGLRLDRPDVVVALTDPPIIGLAAYLASRRFGARWVISYRDIFPEVARLMEDFHSPWVEALLHRINCFLAGHADRVVALGETMRQKLIREKGAPSDRTVVIEDWADGSEIFPGTKQNSFSAAHGLSDQFVVMHSGNIGLSQGLEHLLGAAVRLKQFPDIRVVFVGEGVKKQALEQQALALASDNVMFLPYEPKEQLRNSFAAADVFVISLKKGLAGYIVPSKLYTILAAGRPYVAAVEESCEVSSITRRYDCGLLARPEDPSDLAEKLLALYHDSALRRRLGENARKAAGRFERSRGVQAYHALFQALCYTCPRTTLPP